MARFAGLGLFGLMAVGLWIYCVLDVISSEESLIRNLPKPLWLMVVIFVPTVGWIAWLAVGRPLYAGWSPGDTRSKSRPSRPIVRGPEDDPGWGGATPSRPDPNAARERRLQEREADLERRERELKRREDGDAAASD